MIRAIALLMTLAALMFGTAAPACAESVIRSVPMLDVKLLDPYQNTNYGTRNHGHMIYETLFAWNEQRQPKPEMVDATTVSADQLTWHFTLRPGLKWQDGAPVTSADVLASLEKFLHKDGFALKLAKVLDGIRADGPNAFTIALKEKFPLLLDLLAKPSGFAAFILPERFAKLPDGSPQFEPIGSGPFIFRKDLWQPGNLNVYERNPNYVPRQEPPDGFAGGHVVKVDRVEWHTIPDAGTAANALTTGEIDWIESVPFDFIAQLEQEPSLKVAMSDPLGSQSYLRFNQKLPPFNNAKARQALLYLDDKDMYGLAATGDARFYVACPALFMCGSDLATDIGAIKPDLDHARQLMQESGYKGERVVMMEPTNVPFFDAETLVTASQLRKIGVNVELQPVDYNMMLTRRVKQDPIDQGGWNLYHSGNYGVDVASPMTNIYLNSNCDQAAPGWPCDAEIEALKDQYAKAPDAAARKAIAEKLQLRAFETVPYMNVVQLRAFTAYRKVLSGIVPSPVQLYWNVSKTGE